MKWRVSSTIENKILFPFVCISMVTVLCFCGILYRTEYDVKLRTETLNAQALGLEVRDTDTVRVVNPLVFSTPGLTDESNALICAVLRSARPTDLSQEGAVGSEQFDGFCLLTKAQARELLKKGRDERGKFYPLYTWAALVYFVSDMWLEA